MSEDLLIGLAQCLLSSVFFGSGYVPIRNYDCGDGLYSMLIRSIAIATVGFLTYAYLGFQHFYPTAMLSGVIWTFANVIIVPCIGELGLGVAVLLYCFTNSVCIWMTGNFGLFWTIARPPQTAWLNYVGFVSLLVGGALVIFVRSNAPNRESQHSDAADLPVPIGVLPTANEGILPVKEALKDPENSAFQIPAAQFSAPTLNYRRIIAVVFALFSGFLFAEDATPVIAVQDNPQVFPGAPKDGLPYIFSFYLAILLTSTVIFVGYCVVKKNHPYVSAELTLPSFISGLIWAVAQALLIVSMQHLSMSVSGPIAAIMPACVAACWSVFYFREIKGTKNLLILCASIALTSAGAACIAISK